MRLPSLYQFFRHQLGHGFHRHGITESATVDYVSDILARFAEVRQFYAMEDIHGRPIEYIVDMLETWRQKSSGSTNLAQGRFILRHLGEYTLFMSGLFRARLEARGELDYYLAHGSSAYWRCADCEVNPRQRQVYWHLYCDFGHISKALDSIRRERFPLPPTADNLLTAFWRL